MPHLVLGYDAYVAEFVRERIAPLVPRGFGDCTAIGVAHGGFMLGGVVFHGYQPQWGAIELSFAADSPLWLIGPRGDRAGTIRDILSYPFRQLRVNRITGATPKRSKRARAVVDGLGFKREGVIRAGFGGDDAIISGLLRKEWLAGKFAGPSPLFGEG